MNTHTPIAPIAPNTLCELTQPADPFAPTTPEAQLVARRDAWERTRDARRAVTKEQLVTRPFDLHTGTLVIRGACKRVFPLRAQLAQGMPFDMRSLDMLLTYCAAMLYGADVADDVIEGTPPVALNAEAAQLWDRLMKRLTTLAEDGFFPMHVLDEVRDGTGWRDRSKDISRMATVALQYWERIEGKTSLTRADLSRALTVSNEIDAYFSDKSAGEQVSDVEFERRQAIALAYNAYDDVRRAVSWLRWKERDALEFVPSVYRNAFTKRAKAAESDDTRDEVNDPKAPVAADPKKPVDPDVIDDAKPSDAKKPAVDTQPRSSIFAPARPEDDVIKYAPNGRPLVPQDDPFAKD